LCVNQAGLIGCPSFHWEKVHMGIGGTLAGRHMKSIGPMFRLKEQRYSEYD
jgi:hypothetical protein